MFGVLLILMATLFSEVSDSIGKRKVMKLEESLYTMGFLSFFWTSIWFLVIIFIKGSFDFSLDSLPTFIPRIFLEVILAHITFIAITRSDRSTFGFIRVITIPLLLIVDIILGYSLSIFQLLGIVLIVLVIFTIFINNKISKKGAAYALFTALAAVATLSLYKYNISNFNSVEAEQVIAHSVLFSYFFLTALRLAKENPFVFLKKRIFFTQSFANGISGVLGSFAFAFAPASVIVAAKRSSAILWNISSGYLYFQEKNLITKIVYLILLTAGIILLVL